MNSMKSAKVLVVIALLFVLGTTYVIAGDDLSDTDNSIETEHVQTDRAPKSLLERFRLNKDKDSDRVKTDRATDSAKQIRITNIQNLFKKLIGRLNAAVERLENIGSRLATKLSEMEANGHEVTRYQSDLATASATLDETKILISGLTTKVDELVASQTPREAFGEIKGDVRTIKGNLLEVREMYKNIVKGIRSLEK